MLETIRKNKRMLLITAAIILSPMLAGIILWERLPETMATHWGLSGEANGWSSRGFAVFGLPLFLLAMQVLCLVLDKWNIHTQQNKKVMRLILWIIPVVSLFCGASIYTYALGYDLHIETIAPVFMGVLFIAVGNYLPKCTQNPTVGIKLPWTYESEANWNATHRFGGRLWVAAGVVCILMAFLPEAVSAWIMLPVLLGACFAPMVYSYLYHRRHG